MHSTHRMHKTFWEYHEAFEKRLSAWEQEVLFTWEWWLGIALALIPWILWFIFRKKDSTDRLLYAGIFVSLITVTLDSIGLQLSFWDYLNLVTPAIPSYVPFDFALMPVIVMFLIQVFHNKNPWIIGLIFAILTAYVGESIFTWLQIYEAVNWKHLFSIPFYLIIYVIAYKLSKRNHFNEV